MHILQMFYAFIINKITKRTTDSKECYSKLQNTLVKIPDMYTSFFSFLSMHFRHLIRLDISIRHINTRRLQYRYS